MPSFGCNLISVSVLDKSGYHCSFGDRKCGLYKDSVLIGTGNSGTYDNLYLVDTKASTEYSFHLSMVGTKRKLRNEIS